MNFKLIHVLVVCALHNWSVSVFLRPSLAPSLSLTPSFFLSMHALHTHSNALLQLTCIFRLFFSPFSLALFFPFPILWNQTIFYIIFLFDSKFIYKNYYKHMHALQHSPYEREQKKWHGKFSKKFKWRRQFSIMTKKMLIVIYIHLNSHTAI